MWLELVLLFAILIYLSWGRLFGKRDRNFPPGPLRFPLIGNLPQFGKDPFGSLENWKFKYGNIFGLRFGDFNVVVLHTYELIKEAFDKPEFSGRPMIGPIKIIAGGKKHGLLASEGADSVEQRRFALRNLRDFGFGKKSMEGLIQEDVSEFLQTLGKSAGNPVATNRSLSMVVLSALWNIITGERFAHDDPQFKTVLDSLNAVFESTPVSGPVFFMPWLAKIFPRLSGWDQFSKVVKQAKDLVGIRIKEHKESFDPNNLRDFMDVYLQQIKTTEDPTSSFYKETGDSNMLVAMVNLFGAGAETTSNTLNWAMFFLAMHPNVLKKLQEEIDAVVGRSRLPGFDDRENLPYTKAVMEEVFRKSSFVPFGVFHNTMVDTEFHGFKLPKDTVLMANLYDVHHDKSIWGDSENFRPERFLQTTAEGVMIKKAGTDGVGHVIPFSLGRRACLGETLARNEFFLMLTSIVQRFNVKFDPDNKPPTAGEPNPSLFRFPEPFKVIFQERV